MDATSSIAASTLASVGALRWKRPLDLLVGLLLAILAAPLILALAMLVAIESRGPVFFGQERVGRLGTTFRMWKIRTMYVRCDDGPHRQATAAWFAGEAASGERYKTLSDRRITRVGKVLRKTNLDELPQLLNVLRGEMSLVGPRPAIAYELAHYEPAYMERFQVPPGMTGLWQVTRRDRLSAREMMTLDTRYVRQASLWLDLKILLMTAPALLFAALGES